MRLSLSTLTVGLSLFLAKAGHAAEQNKWIEVQGGAWTVSAATLQAIQSGIVQFIETDNDPTSESGQRHIEGLNKSWSGYTVQYQGQQRHGKKFVFINAMCRSGAGQALRKHFVQVRDGGACYFFLSYDPQKKKFFGLWINGEA